MKFWFRIGAYFKKHWIRLLSFIIYGALIIIIYNAMRSDFISLINYANASFIAGITLILMGGLSIVNYFGGLDIYSYMFLAKRKDGKKEALYDYSLRKKEQRRPHALYFLDYFYIGIIFTAVSLILGALL